MPDLSSLLSAGRIARRLNYDQSAIWRAIRRAGIPPDHTTAAGYCLYHEDKIPLIQAALRKKAAPVTPPSTLNPSLP